MKSNAAMTKGFGSTIVATTACCIWLIFGITGACAQTPQEKAWQIIQTGQAEHHADVRAAAVRALGLLRGDPRAEELAVNALKDKNPLVRAAAAIALGQMGAQSLIPSLKKALADKENRVFFAAADSLLLLGDPSGYDLYREVLTGERRSGEGLIGGKKRLIANRKEMVLLGIGVAAGFAPYAGYGWMMRQELSKDYVTPVRVNALKKLANDPDLRIGRALVKAASDKHCAVRAAALDAIARHGDANLTDVVTLHMDGKKAAVRFTAAAAVLRLSSLVSANNAPIAQTTINATPN